MAEKFSVGEMLRGKKRRLDEIGGFVTGVEAWSEEMDAMLEALLKDGDVGMLSGALERIIAKQKTEFEKASVLAKAGSFGVHLQEVADRLARQQASQHNSLVWPLTQDLTVKVFSLLGTQCLCQVAASCNMFNKLTLDSACYVDVDLTMQGTSDYASKVGNRTINKLVQRAGHNLRSLKLGVRPLQSRTPAVPNSDADGSTQLLAGDLSDGPKRVFPTSSVPHDRDYLNSCCLNSLTANHGLAGALLTKLHLFNLEKMDSSSSSSRWTSALCRALAACPCLTDLEVVGLFINLRPLMEGLGSHCPNLNRLRCHAKIRYASYPEDTLVTKSCNQLIKGCPDISYLALRGYGVADKRANILLKGLPKLTVLDFCRSLRLTGVFLRGIVGPGDQPSQLTTILLRDCQKLKEAEVERFLFMLISGECKSLRHLDISSKGGLAARDWFHNRLSPSTEQAILRVRQERTELCLLADFPDQRSSSESSESDTSLDDSDDSGPHGPHRFASDTSDSDISDDSDDSDDSELHSPQAMFKIVQDYAGDPDLDSDNDLMFF